MTVRSAVRPAKAHTPAKRRKFAVKLTSSGRRPMLHLTVGPAVAGGAGKQEVALMKNFVLLLAIGGLTAACSSLAPRLKAPDLKVVGLNFIGGDAHRQQLQLRVHVTNPNDRQIAVQSIDYQVALAGAHFADGSSAEPFTLPASGQTDFNLNVNANLEALVRVVGAHLGEPALDYEVTGTLHLAESLLREIPFKGHGQLPMH